MCPTHFRKCRRRRRATTTTPPPSTTTITSSQRRPNPSTTSRLPRSSSSTTRHRLTSRVASPTTTPSPARTETGSTLVPTPSGRAPRRSFTPRKGVQVRTQAACLSLLYCVWHSGTLICSLHHHASEWLIKSIDAINCVILVYSWLGLIWCRSLLSDCYLYIDLFIPNIAMIWHSSLILLRQREQNYTYIF